MLTVTESHSRADTTEHHHGEHGQQSWDKLTSFFDRVWPHLAAWGLAGLIAFFAVRERLALMETNATAVLERVRALEDVDRRRDAEVSGIRDDTTRIRTLLEVLAREDQERRADERARYRQQQQ